MTTEELKDVAKDYELFNKMLFAGSLPPKEKIDFQLHSLIFAAGYSLYRDKPNKRTGNNDVIAFCRYFKFDQWQMREILIHEMIHLWQKSVVSAERYNRCTHNVAHERTFTAKMNQINIVLERNGYDLKIDTTFKDKLYLEEKDAKTSFIVLFFVNEEQNADYCHMWKTNTKYYDKVLEDIKKYKKEHDELPEEQKFTQDWGKLYRLDTKDYHFVPFGIKQRGNRGSLADKDIDTGKSLYKMFKDQCVEVEL